jgi:hypothetical protein
LAVHLPNCCMCLVPPTDDLFMVEWHVPVDAEATIWSLAIIPIRSRAGLTDAARWLRRGLRDVRDRMARRRNRWRDVSFAGMIGGDGKALVLVTHDGVDQGEVEAALRRRWPDIVVKGLEQEEPDVAMTADDAAALGQCRRDGGRQAPDLVERPTQSHLHGSVSVDDRLVLPESTYAEYLSAAPPYNRNPSLPETRITPCRMHSTPA